MTAYYGRPILKPPTWTNLIPTYFFAGGLAGVSAMLSFAARTQRDKALERALDYTTLGAIGVSTFCLIKDLGKPMRFINMLRVFKPTSPMSVGTYIFSSFSGAATIGLACDLMEIAPVATAAKVAAAAIGPVLSVYTAVLIADTSVPAWHEGRMSLPAVFAAGAAMSAAGAGLLFGPARGRMPGNLALLGAGAEIAALSQLHHEVGADIMRAYTTGKAKPLMDWARRLAVAGSLLSRSSATPLRRAAGACFLAGALLERYGVMEAGRTSASDPSYVLATQR